MQAGVEASGDGRVVQTAGHSIALPRGFRVSATLLSAVVLAPIGALRAADTGTAPAPAPALTAAAAPTVGTWFEGLGTPYGGCGVPQDLLESPYFVALNVYDTPGEYAKSPVRPLAGADLAAMGEFANGLNCGRWVQVTLGQYCHGTNDGAPGQPFCRGTGAKWVDDAYSGGVLDMIVADSCGDGNAWCRDSRGHLDLSKVSLSHFTKDGQALAGLEPAHWNNRGLAWKYIPAPAYAGDIKIFFLKGTQKYWPAILINNLPNGIHAVEQLVAGTWTQAARFSDMGQGFILAPSERFRIRVYDAEDKLIQGGREYAFGLPASCGSTCEAAATPVAYQALAPDGSPIANAPRGRVEGPRRNPSRVELKVEASAAGLSLEFHPPFAGRWTLTALDPAGRTASAITVATDRDGVCRTAFARLARGVYPVVLQSGSTRVRASNIAIPWNAFQSPQ